jgi:hypothetical protein
MSTFNKTVLDIGEASKGEYTWTTITVKGKDGGKNKVENVMNREIAKYFREKGVGLYSISYEKNDKGYWNVVGAEKLGGSSAAEEHKEKATTDKKETPPASNGTAKQPATTSSVSEVTRLRAEIAAKAIEAVGRVLAEVVAADPSKANLPDLTDQGALMAKTFMRAAREFVTGTAEQQGAAADKAPLGA